MESEGDGMLDARGRSRKQLELLLVSGLTLVPSIDIPVHGSAQAISSTTWAAPSFSHEPNGQPGQPATAVVESKVP